MLFKTLFPKDTVFHFKFNFAAYFRKMETIKHECGVAMVRLMKPLQYYHNKYGTWRWALDKLYLLMEKQHNRGQEGAGLACVKLDAVPGSEYMFRERAVGTNAISEIFDSVHKNFNRFDSCRLEDPLFAENSIPFAGELYMGHLRYSTTGKRGIDYIHPFLRRNNFRARNLALCGNFNLTNVDEVFAGITCEGQHPRRYSDTYIMLEQIGYRLDCEFERLYRECSGEGLEGVALISSIEERLNLRNVLQASSQSWDGGYVICGITGSGDMFAVRDPWGIRTAFYYIDDEVMVLASERPVIQTVLDVPVDAVNELQPGEALILNKRGVMDIVQVNKPQQVRPCSFERIYFSRGSDMDIYRERKALGNSLVPSILKSIDYDIAHTVFSYIPNTAEAAFYGMLEGLNNYLNGLKLRMIEELGQNPGHRELEQILSMRVRSEKVAIKDIKLRTFISEGEKRNDLAAHVYDITYGSIVPFEDNLVIIDDSIVRGTTLKQSIISILSRLHPRKIVIVSSSPQVRYPDYYGIDMSSLDQFIAFRAAIGLLKEQGKESVIASVYDSCKAQEKLPKEMIHNYVKDIYGHFTDEEISARIAELLAPVSVDVKVEILYQTIEGLKKSCPGHQGDWYFSGDYPTCGGLKLLNKAFIDYIENE